jgi:hypothetical protein
MIHHYDLIYHIYLTTVELENSHDSLNAFKNTYGGEE